LKREKKEGEEKKPSLTCFSPPSLGGPHLPLNSVFLLPRGYHFTKKKRQKETTQKPNQARHFIKTKYLQRAQVP
jgi:hypothetical protein